MRWSVAICVGAELWIQGFPGESPRCEWQSAEWLGLVGVVLRMLDGLSNRYPRL